MRVLDKYCTHHRQYVLPAMLHHALGRARTELATSRRAGGDEVSLSVAVGLCALGEFLDLLVAESFVGFDHILCLAFGEVHDAGAGTLVLA